jgi:hypothetical protein
MNARTHSTRFRPTLEQIEDRLTPSDTYGAAIGAFSTGAQTASIEETDSITVETQTITVTTQPITVPGVATIAPISVPGQEVTTVPSVGAEMPYGASTAPASAYVTTSSESQTVSLVTVTAPTAQPSYSATAPSATADPSVTVGGDEVLPP